MEEKGRSAEKNRDISPEDSSMDINTDENIAGTAHLQEQFSEQAELELLKNELQDQKDKFVRLYAEFDNFKRRSARERVEITQTAGKEVISSLLEVLDDCDRAERQLNTSGDVAQIREGVQLVFNKLRTALQSRGLREMKSIGEPFNPDFHEAITEIPVQDASMDGKIVDEVEKGYYLHDRIIRFSKVVVGKQVL